MPDSQHCGLWDERLKKHVIYTRAWNPDRTIARVAVDDLEAPWPYDDSVPPNHVWGKGKVPTLSRELSTVMARDDRDPPAVQLYTNAVIRYPLRPAITWRFPLPITPSRNPTGANAL